MMAAQELGGFVELLRDVSIRFSGPKKCTSRQIIESRTGSDGVHAVVYQREFVRCGKKRCKCSLPGGKPHGPYWYAYWKVAGGTRKKYIGKTFRELASVSPRRIDSVLDELMGKKK